jgi:hypothetical protein
VTENSEFSDRINECRADDALRLIVVAVIELESRRDWDQVELARRAEINEAIVREWNARQRAGGLASALLAGAP